MATAVLFNLYCVTLFCLSSLVDLVSGTWCSNTLDLIVAIQLLRMYFLIYVC